MKHIDLNNYPRADHFNYFKNLDYPFVGVTVDVDVSDLLEKCKEKKLSFYFVFMHICALAADEVKQFRQRILNDSIVEYEECLTSHIELLEDETYRYCTLHHHTNIKDYLIQAEDKSKQCRNNKLQEDDDVLCEYFISTLPWLKYTSLIQPTAHNKESNPRITWGKYEKNIEGKYMMPLSVLCHHALVDGIHIKRFYEFVDIKMKDIIKEIDKYYE